MPYRKMPIVNGETYHIFNRSIAQQPIFINNQHYQRALEVIKYYSHQNLPVRFSHYNRSPQALKDQIWENLRKESKYLVEILAFCIMPNHVHFLIKEIQKRGIATFISNFQNSYAKFFNTKHERAGSLFQAMFKAVRIETDEQLIHVARYIHLNPLTSFILKDIEELKNYPWSSFQIYTGEQKLDIINIETILGFFPSIKNFIKFTEDQINYQRRLDRIKHLTLE